MAGEIDGTRGSRQREAGQVAATERRRPPEEAPDPPRPSLDSERRREILKQLFHEGPARAPYLRQFYTLLMLSSVIATVGLLLDSIAVVIGAMLLSPLMTPLLAIAASIVMGWPARASRNMLRVAIATAFVFVIAYLIPMISGFPQDVDLSEEVSNEIISRTNPNIGDLLVALCAGCAAAYMLVRKEAMSALPGVAIAVALVPPLCVSGILAYMEAWESAWEAFVLFATNLTAIVLTAGLVLLVMGFKPRVRDPGREVRVAVGIGFVAALVLVIAVPLGARAFADLRDLRDRITASRVIRDWIGERDIGLLSLEVEDDVFRVLVRFHLAIEDLERGTAEPGLAAFVGPVKLSELDRKLTEALGKPVQVQMSGRVEYSSVSEHREPPLRAEGE